MTFGATIASSRTFSSRCAIWLRLRSSWPWCDPGTEPEAPCTTIRVKCTDTCGGLIASDRANISSSTVGLPGDTRKPMRTGRARGSRLGFRQQRRDFLARPRRADEVALHLVAAQRRQDVGLHLRFDALGNHGEPERAPERDDHVHPRHGFLVLEHPDDEGAVDLQGLHRQLREISERGVAGAEVVDADADAELGKAPELVDVGLDVLHDVALADLQLDRPRALPP